MVHGVSEQMHQRVSQALDHRPVHFSVLAFHDEIHFLIEFLSQVPDHSRKSVENGADGQHSYLHYFLLQLIHHFHHVGRRFAQGLNQFFVPILALQQSAYLLDSSTVDDQLSDGVQQVVQAFNVNSKGLGLLTALS